MKGKVAADSKHNQLGFVPFLKNPLEKKRRSEISLFKYHFSARLLLITLIFTIYGSGSNKCTHLIIKVFLIEVLRRRRSPLVDLTVGVTILLRGRQRITFIFILYSRDHINELKNDFFHFRHS